MVFWHNNGFYLWMDNKGNDNVVDRMTDNTVSQEILEYLESPFPLKEILIDYHTKKAKAAKNGQLLCSRNECPNYVKRDNDGYGWRECGCVLTNKDYLIQHEICPHKAVAPYRYKPFNDVPTGVIIYRPYEDEIIKAVNEIYKD